MKSIDVLLDDVKARHAIKSDYKLAQFLGLTDGAIRNYRHGRSLPDERACMRIGEALDLDGDVLAAQMFAHRSKDNETQAFWNRIAARLAGAGAAVAGVMGILVAAMALIAGTPAPAQAALPSHNQNDAHSVYYV